MTKLFYQIELIERIDQLIRLRATGSPRKLAERFNVSESTIYRMIDTVKELGGPIEYSLVYQSYIYTEDVNFICGFFSRKLSKEESQKVNGGSNNLSLISVERSLLSKFESDTIYFS